MIRKTITVTEQQNDWIKAEMMQGSYGNESELIRDLIRDRQRTQQEYRETPEEIALIRAKLTRAEESGFSDRSVDDIWEQARARIKGQDAEL